MRVESQVFLGYGAILPQSLRHSPLPDPHDRAIDALGQILRSEG